MFTHVDLSVKLGMKKALGVTYWVIFVSASSK
jgi:hypothetical protein